MKDPLSDQFRNVRLVSTANGRIVCGEVSAKNLYGGYIGFLPFIASPERADIEDRSSNASAELMHAVNIGLYESCG